MTKWNPENLAQAAKEFEQRHAFKLGNFPAYIAAQKRGILDDVCAHMAKPQLRPAPRRWTKEEVTKKAKPFTTRKEFRREFRNAYDKAVSLGWDAECFPHLV